MTALPNGAAPTDAAWVPPETFERKSTKFWAHPAVIPALQACHGIYCAVLLMLGLPDALLKSRCSGSNCFDLRIILQAEVIKHCPLLVFGRRRSDRLTNGACVSSHIAWTCLQHDTVEQVN